MPNQQPIVTSGDHRVIQFRPRKAGKPLVGSAVALPPSAYRSPRPHAGGAVGASERTPPPAELRHRAGAVNYRQRMIVNFAALFFVLFLTGAGVWLATTIRDLRRTQSCLLVGRRDCARLPSPMAPPLPGGRFDRLGEHI
ncbi:MAG: hypothetical protein ACLP8B_00225 [Xanthobacteraceae bacterium]